MFGWAEPFPDGGAKRHLYTEVEAVTNRRMTEIFEAALDSAELDAAVDADDHIALRLDVDRDYASYYELLIDSRGWSADRCWGDSAWNPEWFIAASELTNMPIGCAS